MAPLILGQISFLDCLVFLVFLTPELIFRVGFFTTAYWVIFHSPWLAVQIPIQFIHERVLVRHHQSPFSKEATIFQDIVIRYVRYAFAHLPARIGRVFFSKAVALPFFRFRLLRHGYFGSPMKWVEINQPNLNALYICAKEDQQPDIVVYYCHGGGFSMGSSYFYLEFLMAWVSLMQEAGYRNPALVSVEYPLVPDAIYPKQISVAMAGYQYACQVARDPERVVVAGDSAGATIVLSLLLQLGSKKLPTGPSLPGYCVMLSPWCTVISEDYRNTSSDFLNASSLHLYGSQYLGRESIDNYMASPGRCYDLQKWRDSSPSNGWLFTYGTEEVLAPDIEKLVGRLRKAGIEVSARAEGLVHAWPVASLFLGVNKEARLKGLNDIVQEIRKRIK